MDHYLSVIRDCLEEGSAPDVIWRISPERISGLCGSVLPGTDETDEGYQIPIKGPGLRYHGIWCQLSRAVIPRSVQFIIYAIHTHAGVPHELIEWHGQWLLQGGVNSTTAWLYGCSGVNASLFGIGEHR